MMDQQKAMKFHNITQPTRNWLDLPSEITTNILNRIGAIDILLRAQKVCTAWRKICKDPSMWRVVHIEYPNAYYYFPLDELCKHLVDRSQGQLVDFTIVEFGFFHTLVYIANRFSQLKRLTIACCYDDMQTTWTESLKKLPLLEDLNLYRTTISKEAIETAGHYCSMLKTLKVNRADHRFGGEYHDWDSLYYHDNYFIDDEIALAIGQNLHELRHLELIGNPLSNKGLKMILDGCPHLESLDLRGCLYINLNGDLGKRCSQHIKCLKLPRDSLEGCPYIYKNDGTSYDVGVFEFKGGSDDGFDIGSEGGYDEEFVDEFDIVSDDESDDGY